MASVYQRDGRWVVQWKDGAGKKRSTRTKLTEKQAQHMALELEQQAQRQRLGLEPMPEKAPALRFCELYEFWWSNYGAKRKSASTVQPFAEKHLLKTCGDLLARDVTPAKIEDVLHALEGCRKPRTINQVRGLFHRVFSVAIRRGRWTGANPAKAVDKRRVPDALPRCLPGEWIVAMIEHACPELSPIIEVAAYTGMSKGEVLGLRREDVDFTTDTITIARSYDADTTKGGHADVIPIPDAVADILINAQAHSKSTLMFPRADGSMHPRDLDLVGEMRRALVKAGIVDGYWHRCNGHHCGHRERSKIAEPGRCPKCNRKMWSKPIAPAVLFKDLRSTLGTMLLRKGVELTRVQQILRHKDPTTTFKHYARLDVNDLRKPLNMIRYGR